MAMIIDLQTAISRSSGAARPRSHSSAEIVFFPGVRYERSEPPAPSRERSSRTRRRDKIELPEE